MARAWTGEVGQGSVEWVAVVALVAVLLGATGTALAQSSAVGRRVTRELARAVCIVSAGDCRRDKEPCVLASSSARGSVAVHLAVVTLGGGTIAVLEERSDGTVAVTRGTSKLLRVTATAGPSSGLSLLGFDVSAAAALTAAYGGTAEGGQTWIVPSRAAAEQLVEGLRNRPVPSGGRGAPPAVIRGSAPPPDITYNNFATEATLDAFAGAHVGDGGVTLAAGDLRFDRSAGVSVDHVSGRRTIYVGASSHASLDAVGVLGLSSDSGGETYAVELDAAGRPVDLRVTATGRYTGSADLPAVVAPVAGLFPPGTPDGRAFAVDAHLDLTDPDNLAAARDLLAAMAPHFGAPAAASRALRDRIAAHGTVEARVLEQTIDTASHHVSLPAGPPVSVDWGHDDMTTRLLAATSRGLDGQWITRTDCAA